MAKNSLKEMLKKGPVVMPGSFDCLSALLVEKVGFQATYLSGGALTVSLLGKPDVGFITRDDVAERTRQITDVVKIPLLVDVDTGFGGDADVRKTVQALEKAGAAGLQIEDQVFPKRCGHLDGKEVVPTRVMVSKIKAAVSARKSPRFLIVGRTDARAVNGMEDALDRARAYTQAGADIIFPEALQSREEFAAFGRKKELGTVMANMTEFGHSPSLTVRDLTHLGYRLILYPMTAFRAAAYAMEEVLLKLKRTGDNKGFLNRLQPRRDLYQLIRYDEYANPRPARQKRS